MKITLDGHRSW